ncbi:ribonuclease Z [Halomonas shantousis]
MEMIFLGTSAGIPTKARNVSALAVKKRSAKAWYLIDCGEGTQHQVLRTPLSLNRLEAVLITHVHGDHCYGLPGLLASASMAGRQAPLRIVGPRAIRDFLDAVQASTGLHLTYPVEFHAVEELAGPLDCRDFSLEAAVLSHGVASYGYALVEKDVERKLDTGRLEALGIPSGPDWGRLFRGEAVLLEDGSRLTGEEVLLPTRRARKIVVGGDNDTPHLLDALCRGADVLVHEATYTRDVVARLGTSNQHSTAADVAAFARDRGLANLVLTHFSPRYQYAREATPSIGDIAAEARCYYQGELFLANDFDAYRLSREGVLHKMDGGQRASAPRSP